MSRGGRGGFGGGRGGFRGSSGMPQNWVTDLERDERPTELYPRHAQPVPRPLTKEEKMDVRFFLDHRQKVHDGPLYTVLGKKKSLDDPFNEVPTYSKRYKKVRRKVPKLDARPYVFNLFPEELYSTMDPTYKSTGVGPATDLSARARKKKLAILSLNSALHDGFSSHDEASASEAEGGKSRKREGFLSTLLNSDEDDEGGDRDGDRERDEMDGEEIDEDQFEDMEDDDYNAEQYFDDGENDGDYGDNDDGGDYF